MVQNHKSAALRTKNKQIARQGVQSGAVRRRIGDFSGVMPFDTIDSAPICSSLRALNKFS